MKSPVAPALARAVDGPLPLPSTQNDPGLEMDSPTDHLTKNPLGHQGGKTSGGIVDVNLRVLYCSNIALSLDYQGLYAVLKKFGRIERMKLKFVRG